MKTRTSIAVSALCAVVSLCVPQPRAAIAGTDPEQIAEHCIQEAAKAAEQRMQRNRDLAAQCVRMIDMLMALGQNAAAQAVALQCIQDVVAGSQKAVIDLQNQCAHCIQVLEDMGEPKLAEEVEKACRHAAKAINHSRLAAVRSIKLALQGTLSTGTS